MAHSMGLFRSFSRLRAVVPELQTFNNKCCFTKNKGLVLYRSHNTLQRGAPFASPATQKCLRPHGVPDSHLLPCGVQLLPGIAGGESMLCLGRGWNSDSRRAFQTRSRLNNDPLSQRSKTGDEDGGEVKREAAVGGGQEGVAESAEESRDASPEGDRKYEEVDEVDDNEPIVAMYDETGKPLSNWMRMKMLMKAYGYVVIPVHWIIAPVWFGAFYYTIKMGVDIAPFLLKIGISDHHVDTLQNSGASNVLMAYALYKIFTPLRYTVTLGATEMTIRYLRRKGYIKQKPRKEKTYRQSLKEAVQEVKDKIDNR